ncbi:MAG: hypothetical protein EOO98_00475 [Pedobacter sp.]|nr:MAG: hypothetical protein EOO98_00475 [Pedobacter sp.]
MSVTYAYPYGCIVGGSTGTQVTSFKVNPVLNVPLDDHIWLIMLSGVGLGAFYLTKNKLSLPE